MSSPSHCVLYYLTSLREIPEEVKRLLRDETVVKTGVAVIQDAQKICVEYDVSEISTLFDLHTVSRSIALRQNGLKTLATAMLGVQLHASKKVVKSNCILHII